MARKPQPGGDRNAWGAILNEYFDVAHNIDGTIKPAGVQTAVATEVETALSVQLHPAVVEELALDATVADAAAAAIDAEPRVSGLIADMDEAKPAALRADTRVFDVRAFGAAGSGEAVQAAASEAAAVGGGVVTGPKGAYTFTTALDHPDNVTFDFPLGTVFDFTGVTTFINSHCWYGEGSMTALPALSAAIAKDSRTITFASAPSVVPGDTIMLTSSVDYSFTGSRSNYRKGEMVKVAAVSGSTVTTIEAMYDSYDADGTVTAHRLTPAAFAAHGIEVLIPDGRRGVGFDMATRLDLSLSYVGGNWTALNLWRCANITLNQPRHFSASLTDGAGINYSIGIFNCQNITINEPDLQVGRHGITTGGTDYPNGGSIPNRNIVVNGGVVSSSTDHVSAYGMDFHANTEFTWLNGVRMPRGLHIAGDHIYVDDKCVIESSPSGCAVSVVDIIGWDIVINATIRATRSVTSDGLVFVSPGAGCVRTGETLVIGGKVDIGPYRVSSGTTFVVSLVNSAPSAGAVRLDGRFTGSGVAVGDLVTVYLRYGSGTVPMHRVTIGGEWVYVNCMVRGATEVTLDRPRSVNAPGRAFDIAAPKIYGDTPYVRNAGTTNLYLSGDDATKATGEIILLNPVSLDANNSGAAPTTNNGFTILNAKTVVLIGPTIGDTRATAKQVRAYTISTVGTLYRTPVAILGTVTNVSETPDTTVNV